MSERYLYSGNKVACVGCEACVQACRQGTIRMEEDDEGFRYPIIDSEKCIGCGRCHKVCPMENTPVRHQEEKVVYGGHHISTDVVLASTSGGAFSAIVDGWCDMNYVIFGAESKGTRILHSYIEDKRDISIFRKSKYAQSEIGNSYIKTKEFLKAGKKVLFSGTPCQIAGLEMFLGSCNRTNLLTIEVICEGIPSPLLIRKLSKHYGDIRDIDYRNKTKYGRWDFQMMKIETSHGAKVIDRWFNSFWSIWLQHLISRPSCYECPFATKERVADISLGDLWGVHLFCPELYNHNRGASLIICNSKKGKEALNHALPFMEGHFLQYEEAVKYQSPLRKPIAYNKRREVCLEDLRDDAITYKEIVSKYATKPSIRLLIHKYVWGNRQKMLLWNIFNKRR